MEGDSQQFDCASAPSCSAVLGSSCLPNYAGSTLFQTQKVCVKDGHVNGPEKSRLLGPSERKVAEAREHTSLADIVSGS